MGAPKPKKNYPPAYRAEMNTPAFRARARERLRENKHRNTVNGGERIDDHAGVAAALSKMFGKVIGQTQVSDILGDARTGDDTNVTLKSKYIRPIMEILEIVEIDISVPIERADVLRRIAELPEIEFAAHRDAVASKKPANPS